MIMKALIVALPLLLATGLAQAASVSHYDHIFVIMEENQEYSEVIGHNYAPNINSYASTYGLATNYDSVTHPSAPNYVALVGGSYFGIQDDNAWQTHKLKQPDLTSQIDAAGLTWKGYFQSMPHAGFKGDCSPGACYYASKHNGPIYYDSVHSSKTELKKEVPITKLAGDLASGQLPSFAVIVPDLCHDMHGGAGSCNDQTDQELIVAGDTYLGSLVPQIIGAKFWSTGNNAIVIVWDEGTTDIGGGGHVAAIVITNNGPRALQDGTAYNHYGLLATIQDALGLGCLQNSCTATPMAALFAHP
jgi:hypothetical protein